MVKRMVRHLPLKQLMAMGWFAIFRPRTRGWGRARAAIAEHVAEEEARQYAALGLKDRKDTRTHDA
jgi:heterodisulfide reductase subunit C